MYQFSLDFFVRVYRKSIKQAEKSKKIDQRLRNLIESLKKCVYFEMNRSIFVKHKLLFSLILTLTCLSVNNMLSESEYKFLISGLSGKPVQEDTCPFMNLFTEKQWINIKHLSNLNSFYGLR